MQFVTSVCLCVSVGVTLWLRHGWRKLLRCIVAVGDYQKQTSTQRKKEKKTENHERGKNVCSERISPSGPGNWTFWTFLFVGKGILTSQYLSLGGASRIFLFTFYHLQIRKSQHHVPCYCDMPLHALDAAQYCGSLCWTYCLYEPWLAAGIPSEGPQCKWGRNRLPGVPTISRPLQPLPSYRNLGKRGELWALCQLVWRGGQRLLAGCHVVPGSRDVSAWGRGLYVHFYLVLPEHLEEKHIQHLWIASGYCR